jgi:chromosomal replication initiation ATPase DnaA
VTQEAFATRNVALVGQGAGIELIADRVTTNVRALEGALIRVVAYHSLTHQTVDAR